VARQAIGQQAHVGRAARVGVVAESDVARCAGQAFAERHHVAKGRSGQLGAE